MPLTERGKLAVANETPYVPKTESDWEFKKTLAFELVFAWQDAIRADDKASTLALGRVMFNVGILLDPETNTWQLETRSGGRIYLGRAE